MIIFNKKQKLCETSQMYEYGGFLNCYSSEKKISPVNDSLTKGVVAYYVILKGVPSDLRIDLSGKSIKALKIVKNNYLNLNLSISDKFDVIEGQDKKISGIKKKIVDCEIMFLNSNRKDVLDIGSNIPNFSDIRNINDTEIKIINKLYYNAEIEFEIDDKNYFTFFEKFKNEGTEVSVKKVKSILLNQINSILQEKTIEYAEKFKGNELYKNKSSLINKINAGFLEEKIKDENTGKFKSLTSLYGLKFNARFINPELNN